MMTKERMHEASLALRLVEMATQAALEAGARRVLALRVSCGALSGVASAALRSAFEIAAIGTSVEGAALELLEESLVVHCASCQKTFSPEEGTDWHCPSCGLTGSLLSASHDVELLDMTVEN